MDMMKTRQVYRTHSLLRRITRHRELNNNKDLVKKNRDSKILVVLHLFYPKSWKEIQEYLDNLSCYNYDLIVTITKGMIPSDVLKKVKKFKSNVTIIECENKGFDLRPFLIALKSVNLDDYDVVFKLQSKSTKRAWLYIYEQLFLRRDWFLDLYEGVLSSKVVHKNIDILVNDESIGLIAADNLIVQDPLHKVRMVQKKAKEKNIYIPNDYKFVAGTCFAIKAKCLKNIKNFSWTDADFKTVSSARGMSFAHFFERYICTQVETVWNMKIQGTSIRRIRHAILTVPNKILYRFSSNRLFDEEIEIDPEFFYWVLDNKLITWKYDDVPFKKIIYLGDGFKRPFIENEPYRYLKGDIDGYKKYCDYHVKHGLPVMSIERFENLKKSISENGYDQKYVIIVNHKNELMDGQHRAACLCYEFGEDASVRVLKVRFLGIKETVKNLIPDYIIQKIKKIKRR